MNALISFFEWLFDTAANSTSDLILRTLVFLLIFFVCFYLGFWVLSRVIYRPKGKHGDLHRDETLALTYYWSLVILMLVISTAVFFLLYLNMQPLVQQPVAAAWLGSLPILLAFVATMLLFFIPYTRFRRSLTQS